MAAVLLVLVCPAAAQRRFDVTPLFGYRSPLITDIEKDGQSGGEARLAADSSVGLAAGVRWEDTAVVEFRFTRQNTQTAFTGIPLPQAAPLLSTRLEQYHADFTREFPLENAPGVRPFLTGSVGLTRFAWPGRSTSRMSFGPGGGWKYFPVKWFGLRVQAQWLPVWLNPQVKGLVCGAGCVVVIGGKLADQFEVSFGPTFSF
jgi:hypothetical protein